MKNSRLIEEIDSMLIVDSLQERVYKRLKKSILFNKLKPGQQLNIDQLASDLGVSQTPVREALAMLKLDGLVTKGYYKTPIVSEIEAEDVREIYEVRKMMECFALKKVAGALNEGDLEKLGKIILNIDKTSLDTYQESLTKSDVDFHGFFISRVENNTFFRMYKSIEDLALRIRTLVQAQTYQNTDIVVNEHKTILDSLHQGDTDTACQNLITHLSNACERTLNSLSGFSDNLE